MGICYHIMEEISEFTKNVYEKWNVDLALKMLLLYLWDQKCRKQTWLFIILEELCIKSGIFICVADLFGIFMKNQNNLI